MSPKAASEIAPADAGASRPTKPEQILAAAQDEFLRAGYEKTSMDAICRQARVSKATLYVYFPGKDRLFSAIVAQATQAFADQVHRLADTGPRDCRAMLNGIGQHYLTLLTSPAGITLFRIVIAEAPQFPDLGRLLLENSRAEIYAILGDVLRQLPHLARAGAAEIEQSVALFLSLVRGDLHLRTLLDPTSTPTGEQMTAHVAQAVDQFFKAADLGPRPAVPAAS